MASCCRTHGFAYEEATCKGSVEGQFRALMLKEQAFAAHFDPVVAGQCLEAFNAVYSGCGSVDPKTFNDTCRHIFAGTVAPGAACSDSSECKDPEGGNAYCDTVCKLDVPLATRHGTAGEACSTTCSIEEGGSNCNSVGVPAPGQIPSAAPAACYTNDGLKCDGISQKCVALPKLGESCTFDCAAGSYCSSGKCAAQVDIGSCANYSTACSSKSYCNFDTHECAPRKQDGDACQSGGECQTDHCTHGRCGKVPVNASICAGLVD
jgi:hypothetical protein